EDTDRGSAISRKQRGLSNWNRKVSASFQTAERNLNALSVLGRPRRNPTSRLALGRLGTNDPRDRRRFDTPFATSSRQVREVVRTLHERELATARACLCPSVPSHGG